MHAVGVMHYISVLFVMHTEYFVFLILLPHSLHFCVTVECAHSLPSLVLTDCSNAKQVSIFRSFSTCGIVRASRYLCVCVGVFANMCVYMCGVLVVCRCFHFTHITTLLNRRNPHTNQSPKHEPVHCLILWGGRVTLRQPATWRHGKPWYCE